MSREVAAVIVIAVIALALGLMALGWRRRRARQADLPELAAAPADAELGDVHFAASALHVATTRSGDAYDRIAVRGLGFRSAADLTVADAGLVLALTGQPVRLIPVAALEGVARATWTIDRAVERDGLVRVTWRLGDARLDSDFRTEDPAALVRALGRILPATESEAA
ncbi:PH-like domain-containing protein [Homoserinibacter sp. YIM 151385]|uniref:PH-like domain-containing protein n=1 Tax=Homoserinibacter sp. YIM 151385 TaxID=2985506 RepID=UPI0022EFDB7D|nr:hypothetical protein [Homoserinibacter sp. YIM 151385]WBU38655.1 hypothetical protein OF852_03450 [Homoserinibacter sp. YIM 151385]